VQFDRVLAVFDYADPGDLLVRQYKHLCRFGMAPMLARLLSRALDQAVVPLAAPDCVVPVPSHPSMLRQRGFSPAAQLAVHLCHLRGWHAHLGVLARRTHTGLPQKALGRLQRAQQAQGMYHCTRSVNGLSVLVVDDVMTTGSTLNAVAEALLHAGAVSVNGLVLARTPAHQARARRLPGR
jgi:ComF family protein